MTLTDMAFAAVGPTFGGRGPLVVQCGIQQSQRSVVVGAARGFRTASNFIAIAYLRMSKLKHLPAHPFAPALAK